MKQFIKSYLQRKKIIKPTLITLFVILVLALNCFAVLVKIPDPSLNREVFIYHSLSLLILPGFFLLLRELNFSRKIALLGTFLLTISAWRVASFGFDYIDSLVPLFVIWGFYFLFKWQKNDLPFKTLLAFSGVFLGAGVAIAWQSVFSIILILFSFFILTKKEGSKPFSQILVFIACFLFSAGFFFSLQYFSIPAFNNSFQHSWQLAFENPDDFSALYLLEKRNPQIPIIPPAWAVLLVSGILLSLHKAIKGLGKFKKTNPAFSNFLSPELFSFLLLWPTLLFGIFLIQPAQEFIPKYLQIIAAAPAALILIILPLEYLANLQKRINSSESKPLKPKRLLFLNSTITGLILLVILSGLLDFLAIIKL